MPKAPYVPQRPVVPWLDLAGLLGKETSETLTHCITEITRLSKEPTFDEKSLAPIIEILNHARRAAQITYQFSKLRPAPENELGFVSLRQIIVEVLDLRSEWLAQHKVNAQVGALDAKLIGNIPALFILIDELVGWAGRLAPEIVLAIEPSAAGQSQIRLRVAARLQSRSVSDAEWKNVGWYLWHKLAAAVGGAAVLDVTDEEICVSITFTPNAALSPPSGEVSKNESSSTTISTGRPANSSSKRQVHDRYPDGSSMNYAASVREFSTEQNIAEVVRGCHVKLILTDAATLKAVSKALMGLGLQLTCAHSIDEVLATTSTGPIPHAVIYDHGVNVGKMLQLRNEWSTNKQVAYIELYEPALPHESTSFHFTSLGSMSTAHVSVHAVQDSLAPALLFELCKVL